MAETSPSRSCCIGECLANQFTSYHVLPSDPPILSIDFEFCSPCTEIGSISSKSARRPSPPDSITFGENPNLSTPSSPSSRHIQPRACILVATIAEPSPWLFPQARAHTNRIAVNSSLCCTTPTPLLWPLPPVTIRPERHRHRWCHHLTTSLPPQVNLPHHRPSGKNRSIYPFSLSHV